ncbi:hypothetical protein OH76DRAFT_116078 [Lentinus brumalis]|uniref:Uncharacterized protein n=1 Tax=Lentinus brumalis TaxID=2498619 RepID=A0A371DJE4_9APHY|nr:hypothetical protein OH76DRAFT_116078 [Polyporus brumalis]
MMMFRVRLCLCVLKADFSDSLSLKILSSSRVLGTTQGLYSRPSSCRVQISPAEFCYLYRNYSPVLHIRPTVCQL